MATWNMKIQRICQWRVKWRKGTDKLNSSKLTQTNTSHPCNVAVFGLKSIRGSQAPKEPLGTTQFDYINHAVPQLCMFRVFSPSTSLWVIHTLHISALLCFIHTQSAHLSSWQFIHEKSFMCVAYVKASLLSCGLWRSGIELEINISSFLY